MPLYEYRCSRCQHVTEVIQKFSDPPLKTCSECGGRLEQVLSAPAIKFKGSGWYVTDYAGKGSSSKSESEKSDSNESDASKSDKPKKESKETSKSEE